MKSIWLIIIAVIIAAGAWYWFYGEAPAPAAEMENGEAAGEMNNTSEAMTPMTAAVTYNGSAFSPSEVTVKKGGTVTFMNQSGGVMWVASAMHPTHAVYSGTDRASHCPDTQKAAFDQCAGEAGDYSFTFNGAGSWGYHDHINTQAVGRVLVIE